MLVINAVLALVNITAAVNATVAYINVKRTQRDMEAVHDAYVRDAAQAAQYAAAAKLKGR